jgi:hypothetical protein
MGSTTTVRSESAAQRVASDLESHADAVREQLGRLLASNLFRNSKHYPGLLRYVVERTLEDGASNLKERALGIAVFGRDPNYDTNLDPVVRTSACEVRKRLSQYYSDPAHESEIRIDLPPGSYVPDFRFPHNLPEGQAAAALHAAPPLTDSAAQAADRRTPVWGRPWYWIGAATIALASLAVTAAGVRNPRSAVERFWNPVWGDGGSVVICVAAPYYPDPKLDVPDTPAGPSYLNVMRNDRMAFGDALTMARITGLAREFGKDFEVRRGTASTLADFRKGPAVLIGAFNNQWTMRLENQLRYTFEPNQDNPGGFIRDRQNPSKIVWVHHPELPYSRISEDYAIVSRFIDSRTEQAIVVVAGMGKDGTIAAGEFVTQTRYLEALATVAPKGWERKNLQVVIATELINGNPAPPRILATHFW